MAERYPLDPFDHDAATIDVNGRPVRFHFHPPEDCPDCRTEGVSARLPADEQPADGGTPTSTPRTD